MLLLTGCQAPDVEQAPQLIQSKAWRMDASGQASLQDVRNTTDWTPLPEWKSWGFGQETVWVRLVLNAAPQETSNPWVVRVRPPFLDYVTLHDPSTGLVLRTGDALPPDHDGMASINFTFQIPPLPYERTVYLQLRTSSARTLNVEVLPYGQAQQRNRLQEWLMGFAMVCSIIFAIWACAQWWVTRETVIGAFALKQLFAAAWAFFIWGFARVLIGPWLSEGVLTTMASTVFIVLIGMTLWFFSKLIQSYRPPEIALTAIHSLAWVAVMLPFLQWLDQTQLMLALANKMVVLGFALLPLVLLTAYPKRVKQAIPIQVLLIYMMVYGTLNSLPSLIHLGWIDARPIVLFGSLAHTVLDGLVMFVMLQIRASAMRKVQVQIALDLKSSQRQTDVEKHHREEQSQLFAMLAHEMKTPLATLRMWKEAGQLKPETIERAIADMNQVIERCLHTGQLADQGLQALPQAVNAELLTRNCIASCRSPEKLTLTVTELAGSLHTDEQMLSIVLGNLLDNACKYGALDKPIHVTLQSAQQAGRSGWCWQIESHAGSAGLPDARRLFEKYYRSPEARRLSGSGLGLFLVKGLLELMQGTIEYRAESDRAVFRIWLPDHLS
jgi:signal transduction histidine kinase